MTADERRVWQVTVRLLPPTMEMFPLYRHEEPCHEAAPRHRWVCTRARGHDGPHVAHIGTERGIWVGLIWIDDHVLHDSGDGT